MWWGLCVSVALTMGLPDHIYLVTPLLIEHRRILIFSSPLHALLLKGVRKKEQWLETHPLGLCPFRCFQVFLGSSPVLQTYVSCVRAAPLF